MEEIDGGDQIDQFHHIEAISAVADDGFLGEEDDDYEDLYNDVNIGEGFFQSVGNNEEIGFQNKNDEEIRDEEKTTMVEVAVREESIGGDVIEQARISGYENHDGGIESVKNGSGVGSGGLRVELTKNIRKTSDIEERADCNVNLHVHSNNDGGNLGVLGSMVDQSHFDVGAGSGNAAVNESVVKSGSGVSVASNGYAGGGVGGTVLFVGDLHWWTTDAELEAELCKYGAVKEVKFFDEKASGKSKGYCQVEFYDQASASVCKDGMNGHEFNGRPCVVAFASPFSVRKMGEAQMNRNQQMMQGLLPQGRRGCSDGGVKSGGVGSNMGGPMTGGGGGGYQGGEGNRGYTRGNWGRGNSQGPGGRGPAVTMRNRGGGGVGGRGLLSGGNGFGQGIGIAPPLLHPNAMMGQGFDPGFGGPMGRMGGFGGFPAGPTPPFSGMMPSFPPMGNMGLPGVAPHVNPAFFARGMQVGGMGMAPTSGIDGPNMGMWSDPSMGGWGGEDHGGVRAAESSFGEEAASDHHYGEVSHERGGWQNKPLDKDRASEREWSGSSDRRYHDDRDAGHGGKEAAREKDIGSNDHDWPERRHRDERDIVRDHDRADRERDRAHSRDRERERERDRNRDRYRDDRDKYSDHHRHKERDVVHDDDWERGRSSRPYSKSRGSHEDDYRSRSRDADYGKRRRLVSE